MIKAIHVWIPKTAGNSMLRAYEQHIGGRWINWYRDGRTVDVSRHTVVTFEHAGIPALIRRKYLSVDDVNSRVLFAVIRNPWERLVSLAAHHVRKRRAPTIEQRLSTYLPVLARGRRRPLGIRGDRSLNPAVDWLSDEAGMATVDLILRFEQLADHWKWFCEAMEWPEMPLPRFNRSPHRQYQDYFNTAARDVVGEYYQEDIELGGYRFDDVPTCDRMIANVSNWDCQDVCADQRRSVASGHQHHGNSDPVSD